MAAPVAAPIARSMATSAAIPMQSPTAAPGGAELLTDPSAEFAASSGERAEGEPEEEAKADGLTLKDKAKAKAWGSFMAVANVAKAGAKFGIAKGKEAASAASAAASEKAKEVKHDVQTSERYLALKAKFAEAFTKLPVGVQAFVANPSADTMLAHPQNLFHVAALLAAINHPERATFEAAIAGSAAVALAQQSAQQNGGAALSNAQAMSIAASQGGSAVANKYNPAQGSATHAAVTVVASQLAASRAASAAPSAAAAAAPAAQHSVAATYATGVVNTGAGQLLRLYVPGCNMQPNFSPSEVKAIAGAIKPQHVDMLLRVMTGLR